ncbi:hypothetical protein GC093_05245 [Paenibacillus sp. LMG 31456]|uniref:Copper amine oxidase-like N-terminal domain-containing protein n=1 Tax=Paenibacillus foliorum TaxID=2654974 RepID=A0A972JZD8_9BACL|nr:stalk domain-containing protein [Paenibacillus foliorum]NOU92635.1 hypothetical protein [Paenibacillus foliorum]
MRKKVVVSLAVALAYLGSLTSSAMAADAVKSDLKVLLSGKAADFSDHAYLVDNSLYAPYELIAKAVGAEAKWDAMTKTLTLSKDGNTIQLTADTAEQKVNGLAVVTGTPLQVINGNAYVPVRLVYETFGNQISYDSQIRTVSLATYAQPGFKVFGVGEQQYVTGSELRASVVTLNQSLKDYTQNKEPKKGEGHIHAALDADPLGESALQITKGEPVIFKNLKPGEHTLNVQLVGNDHKAIQPEVKQAIKFRSVGASILTDLDPEKGTGMRIEGVTGDKQGRLYTIDMDSKQLFRIAPETGKAEVLTVLPRSATGMVFDSKGNLYMASGGGQGVDGVVLRVPAKALEGGAFDSSLVETFVSGTNGANGLVFDASGNLYVSGGATGNVYVVKPNGESKVWASGIAAERKEQLITVNGLDFGKDGLLYIANTSSGEIHRVKVNADGSFGKVERVAKDPLLYGADGIMFGPDGDLYVCANERNAIVKVTINGKVTEVAANDNKGILEFPASLHFVGNTLYISNFDVQRGANNPNAPGIGASIVKLELGGK